MPTREERLSDLLVRWEEERGQSDRSAESFCRRHGCADLIAEFREMVACIDSLHLVEETELNVDTGEDTPPADGRFKVKGVLGRGGLGVVYLAEDVELEREVALKQLQKRAAADAMARDRFEREAKVTGRLDHPGVVPVHALARSDAGQIYYTMRVIGGESMRDAITAYHAAEPHDRPAALRRLLRGFIAACETVAYAHNRGVIHRDLKPHNIMLGAYGETLVIDWGLAGIVGSEQRAVVGKEESSRPMALPPAGSLRTADGRVMGTWGYMSPEQGRGEWDRVGPASDIFSLGATLYCVLTGRAPYSGLGVEADVLACRFEPPSRIASRVPKPLEAICLKAMAPDPAQRYHDARDLAADVERWLADEPVSAYRDPLPVRTRRWAKRHRTLVATALALLVTAVVGLAAGLFFVGQEQRRTELARQQTKDALDRVILAQRRTRQALDDTTDIAVERQLTRQRKLTAADRDFLKRILTHYRELAAEAGNTPEARESVADAHFRSGSIYRQLGDREAAEADYRASHEMYTALIREAQEPAASELRYQRARALNNLAILLLTSGRADEAQRILTELAEELPGVIAKLEGEQALKARQVLGYVFNGLGQHHLASGRRPEAAASFRQAAEVHRELAILEPGNPQPIAERARALGNLGAVQLTIPGQRDSARENLHESRRLLEQLQKENPEEPTVGGSLTKTLISLADESFLRFRIPDGVALLKQAVDLLRPLARDYPSDIEYRAILAHALRNLGVVQSRVPGAQAEAEGHLTEALNHLERLIEEDPSGIDQHLGRALARNSLGNLRRKSDPAAAARLYDGAIEDFQKVIDGGNAGRVAPPMLVAIHLARAELAVAANQHDKAVAALRSAVDAGFKNVNQLRGNTYAPLRDRDDFKQLLQRLEPKS